MVERTLPPLASPTFLDVDGGDVEDEGKKAVSFLSRGEFFKDPMGSRDPVSAFFSHLPDPLTERLMFMDALEQKR